MYKKSIAGLWQAGENNHAEHHSPRTFLLPETSPVIVAISPVIVTISPRNRWRVFLPHVHGRSVSPPVSHGVRGALRPARRRFVFRSIRAAWRPRERVRGSLTRGVPCSGGGAAGGVRCVREVAVCGGDGSTGKDKKQLARHTYMYKNKVDNKTGIAEDQTRKKNSTELTRRFASTPCFSFAIDQTMAAMNKVSS